MSRFELTSIPEHEFPTKGRSYSDRIINEVLATEGNTFRLTLYRDSGELMNRDIRRMLAASLKQRIDERNLDIEVASDKDSIYLRRSCTPPR